MLIMNIPSRMKVNKALVSRIIIVDGSIRFLGSELLQSATQATS